MLADHLIQRRSTSHLLPLNRGAGVVLGLMVIKALVLIGLGTFWKLKLDQRFLFALPLAQGSELPLCS